MRCLKTGSSQRVVQMRREFAQRKQQIIQKRGQDPEGRQARRKRRHDGDHEGNRERTVRRALGVPSTRHADRSISTSMSAPKGAH